MTIGPYSVGGGEQFDSVALRQYIRGVRDFGGGNALSDVGGTRGASAMGQERRNPRASDHGLVPVRPGPRPMNPLLAGLAGIDGGCNCQMGLGDFSGLSVGEGFDWGALIDKSFDIAGKIIMTQPGTYSQVGSNIVYRQPLSAQNNLPFAAGTVNVSGEGAASAGLASSGTLLLIGGAVLLIMITRGR